MNDADKVAYVLKKRGWHQGGLTGPDGSVCLIGAAIQCSDVLDSQTIWGDDGFVETKLVPVIERLYPERRKDHNPGHRVAQFNDHPDTTLEDVHLVLKHAREE